MYTTKERADIRQLVVNAFQCDENVAFLEKCLVRYFKSPTAHKYIHDTIDDLVANFDVEATMQYSDFIVTPSVQNMVDTLNKLFLHDRIVFIQEIIIKSRVGRCVEPNSRKYVLRDGKIKGRRPDARLMGPVHGSDLPRNDYENGQPRKQFWRYAKDTSPRVDTYNFPARLDGMRDDSAGVQTYRGAQFALVGVEGSKNIAHDTHPATGCANGSDYNIGATHYNTTIHQPEWRGSGGGCVPHEHYDMISDVLDEPVYEYGDGVPQSQSQTNEDTGQYHDSLHDGKELFDGPDNAHHLDRMFTTSIQDLNDDKAWQTTESDTMFGNDTNGQPIRYTNNYNRNDKHGSSVESERSHHSFHEKRVFRNNNKLQDRAISRRYERDVEENIGGFENDFKLYKHDMESLHCRHSRDPCGPRPLNDPFEHRYKSSNPPYLGLNGKPMYYPKDRPSVTIGY